MVKQKIESLENEQQLLDDILAAIRVADPAQLNGLINLIRSHVTKQKLRNHIEDTFSGSPMSVDIPLPTNASRRRRMRGRIQDIVNPIISVPARPWTTVTDDNDLVSHLMSLWFTWAHQWWQWLDKPTFIEAMQEGDLNSPLCSPYMVNMVLADACVGEFRTIGFSTY